MTDPTLSEYALCGYLTLQQLRTGDIASYLDAVDQDPRIATKLGLSGAQAIAVTLLDLECDYFLESITVDTSPEMSAWDIMRAVADHFAAYSVMDTFVLAVMHFDELPWRLDIALYAEPNQVLTEEELDQMPWSKHRRGRVLNRKIVLIWKDRCQRAGRFLIGR
jgi:hypothetical protein